MVLLFTWKKIHFLPPLPESHSSTICTRSTTDVYSAVNVTFIRREMFLNRAREPYEPNMSAAMMTPPLNFTPSTDVPVTIGLLWRKSGILAVQGLSWEFKSKFNSGSFWGVPQYIWQHKRWVLRARFCEKHLSLNVLMITSLSFALMLNIWRQVLLLQVLRWVYFFNGDVTVDVASNRIFFIHEPQSVVTVVDNQFRTYGLVTYLTNYVYVNSYVYKLKSIGFLRCLADAANS